LLLFLSLIPTTIFCFVTTAYVPLGGQCAAQTCYGYTPCSSINTNCSCFATSTGGGICGLGNIPCVNMSRCNNNTLTCNNSQSVCIINTCCLYPVCLSLSLTGNSICPSNYSYSSSNKWKLIIIMLRFFFLSIIKPYSVHVSVSNHRIHHE
jgi:hypothetical protein